MMEYKFNHVNGGVNAPLGFKTSGVEAQIRYKKKDLALILSEVPAMAAGVFTTNKVKAAPVKITQKNLADGSARAVVVNSGCANACTGEKGLTDARKMAEITAEILGIEPSDVLVASTGVIGQELPMDKITSGIKKAVELLSCNGGHDAALAIMTTDTHPKEAAVQFFLDGRQVTIGGMAKGSGMIHPNMATMLAFITSDINITPEMLDKALRYVADRTFNSVTVDGDTSTNDTAVILANGLAGNKKIESEDENYLIFRSALLEVCTMLAKMIAKDGEGATKLVEVKVLNAPSYEDAKKAAKAVANSNLVKTAIFGEDANWGRIICAIGYSGADINPDVIDIYLGDEKMASGGVGLDFSEERAKKILEKDTVQITINLNSGYAEATVWTCDFSYDYVKINADYRT